MNKFRFTVKIFAIAIFMFAFASLAQAQASRTWVSGVGDDANPCSRTAPCKTWAGAISKTAACGEIDALDPGGFGAVTITKSITLDGTGTFASILASLTTGIIINVGATTDVVTIRGISINGFCNGVRGINITGNMPKAVNIEDCVIFRFANEGIRWSTTAGTVGRLNIRNSVIRDNTGDAVSAATTAGQVKGTFENCSFLNSGNGVHAQGASRLTADHCQFSGNTSNGALADAAGVGVLRISHSAIHNNGSNGVSASNGSVITINDCDIHNNTGNGAAGGAAIETFGNNRIFANGTDACPGCTGRTPS